MKTNFDNEQLTRQLDIIPVDVLGEPITIIGAGAIGSFTALSLVKMGFGNIRVFDFDTVDVVNLNSQFYRFKDIGKLKVRALADLIHEFTDVRIEAIGKPYTGGVFAGIVISAVDSMQIRKLIWDEHVKSPGVLE
jgi:molybdopterin/thiamine biosynthesis adenylyltransferase